MDIYMCIFTIILLVIKYTTNYGLICERASTSVININKKRVKISHTHLQSARNALQSVDDSLLLNIQVVCCCISPIIVLSRMCTVGSS